MITTKDSEFKKFGIKIDADAKEILKFLKDKTPMPAEGNIYVPNDDDFLKLKSVIELGKTYFDEEIQAGYCNGNNSKLNCLEWHNCPEINVATEDIVLLLATQNELNNFTIDSKDVSHVLIKKGEVILIYPKVLHFSPCKTTPKGFKMMVILTKGTNTDIEGIKEDRLLFQNNKWLIAHKDAPQAKKGAFIGITGENIEVKC